MRNVRAAAAVAVALLLLASPASAGPEDIANDIASKVMSLKALVWLHFISTPPLSVSS